MYILLKSIAGSGFWDSNYSSVHENTQMNYEFKNRFHQSKKLKYPKNCNQVISIVSILVTVFLFQCNPDHPGKTRPKINHGILKLHDWDLGKDGTIALNGQWDFFWNQFLYQKDFTGLNKSHYTDLQVSQIDVPGGWHKKSGKKLPAAGYATYRLKVRSNPETSLIALYIPGIYTAFEFEVDGKVILKNGQISKSRSLEIPWKQPVQKNIILKKNSDFIFRVSNHNFRDGGIRKAIILGTPKQIRSLYRNKIFSDSFLIAVYFVLFVYHILLFSLRTRNFAPLFLALACFFAAIRASLNGEQLLMQLFPWPGFSFYLRMDYLTLFFTSLFIGLFFHTLFPVVYDKRKTAIVSAILFMPFIPALFLTIKEVSSLVSVFQITIILVSTIYAVVLLIAVFKKRPGSKIIFFGGIILFICVIHDILSARGIIQRPQYGQYGLLFFVFIQAFFLSIRYANAFHSVEKLSAKLEENNSKLTKLDHLKDEFLANTSHELRTPLNGIIGLADSMLIGSAGPYNNEALNNLTMISSSGRRLANLVNDILDFSKLKHNDIQLNKKAVDLYSIVNIVLSLSKPLVKGKPIQILNLIDQHHIVYADENRLEQILVNLIGNAIKFTKKGSISIESEILKNNFLEITVVDTGIGIPKKKHEVIFESFSRVDSSITREYSGTGLGLAVTKNLVELHNGNIRVESTPTKGTKFAFSLPLYNDKEHGIRYQTTINTKNEFSYDANINEIHSITQLKKSPPANAHKIKIMIVDDDPVNRQVLKSHLSLMNHETIEASNGKKALEIFNTNSDFDLILLDVMMPGLSGYDVCNIIRQTHSPTQLPIILLSAKNRIKDLVAGLDIGANDFLTKPFHHEELTARVNTMLKLRDAVRSQTHLAKIENEMSLAQGIQKSLLPKQIPDVNGVDLEIRYKSIRNVGGDFYDFRANETGLGILLADVSGHGVPAALIVSIVKMAFWFQKDQLDDPSLVLSSMNQILCGNIGNEFVSSCYAFLDHQNRKLMIGNAGHPPLYIWKNRDKELLSVRPAGKIMGIKDLAAYQTDQFNFESQDRFIFYTDGIFEAAAFGGESFGEERFCRFIKDHSYLNAKEFSNLLIATVTDWCGGEDLISDDIALIVIDIH